MMIARVKQLMQGALASQSQGALLASGAILIGVYLALKLRKRHAFFADRNIPGPRPLPVIGHLHKFIWSDTGLESVRLAATYGKIYGLFLGLEPRLMIADAQTIIQICIKDFEAFTDHHGIELRTKYQDHFLFIQKGNAWRRNRIFTSPTFTSAKIKQMFKLLDICAQDLTLLIEEQIESSRSDNKKPFAVIQAKEIFSMYTLDAIARCCYGLELERAQGVNSLKEASARNQFVAMCEKLFSNNLARVLPEVLMPTCLMKRLGYTVVPVSTFEPVAQLVQKMVRARKEASKSNQRFYDYLQMLVDAKIDDKMQLDELDAAENHHASLTHDSLRADQASLAERVAETPANQELNRTELSDIEVVSNAMFLLFVGYETTASLLSTCVYALSFHKQIQDKLHEEIMKIVDRDENGKLAFDYEKLTTCNYLDAVVSETLRHSPIVPMVDREANRDYYFEKLGFGVPKGTVLFVAIQAIHHNAEYWPEPHKFDPERFMPGRRELIVPGSYVPFGQGPRHCVGMRFSLTEGKLALARVIAQFSFEPVPGLAFPPARKHGFFLGAMQDPRVIVRER